MIWWYESSKSVWRVTVILMWLGSALLWQRYRNWLNFHRKERSYALGTPYTPFGLERQKGHCYSSTPTDESPQIYAGPIIIACILWYFYTRPIQHF